MSSRKISPHCRKEPTRNPTSVALAAQYAIEGLESRRLLSTIYVDANCAGATHDGSSWGSAYLDLQQGLSGAVSGDQIRIADGTYKPTATMDRTISFALKSGVSVYGG